MRVFIVTVYVRDAWYMYIYRENCWYSFWYPYIWMILVEQVQQIMPTHKMSKEQKKRKGKTQIYKGPRKSKKTG